VDNETRKLPRPPEFPEFDFSVVPVALRMTPPDRLPWVPRAVPHQDPTDERVFARFVAIDKRAKVWVVRGLLAHSSGGPVVLRQVTFEPFEEGDTAPEISSADVRELRLGAIRDRALQMLLLQGDVAKAPELASAMFLSEEAVEAAREAASRIDDAAEASRGRPRLSDELLERVARLYIELFQAGTKRGIIDALAQRLDVPRETARDWVARSRGDGFLAPTVRGRAYGAPGPRLLDIDEEKSDRRVRPSARQKGGKGG
jgi:hypothetical protein